MVGLRVEWMEILMVAMTVVYLVDLWVVWKVALKAMMLVVVKEYRMAGMLAAWME